MTSFLKDWYQKKTAKVVEKYKAHSFEQVSIDRTKLDKGQELKKYLPQTPDCLELISVKDIELMYFDKIQEIQNLVAIGSRTEFDYLYGETIRSFISYAHLLPASAGYHHEYPGGLVEHSLEVAKLALEIAKSNYKMPPSQFGDIDVIRKPRWMLAVFLHALFHDSGKYLLDMRVISEQGDVWNPYVMPLTEWAAHNGVVRYTIDFRHGRKLDDHVFLSNFGFQFAVPKHVLAFLEKTNDKLVLAINHSLIYQYRYDLEMIDKVNKSQVIEFIYEPVRQADQLSTYNSLITYVNRFFGPGRTSVLGLFIKILSALKSRWPVNQKDGVVFTFEGEVYLHYPKFILDVIDFASFHNMPLPKNQTQLMDDLVERGVFTVTQGSPIFRLKPLHYKARKYLTVVKLSNPAILYGQEPVIASPDTIVKSDHQFAKETGTLIEGEVSHESGGSSELTLVTKESVLSGTQAKKVINESSSETKLNKEASKQAKTKTKTKQQANTKPSKNEVKANAPFKMTEAVDEHSCIESNELPTQPLEIEQQADLFSEIKQTEVEIQDNTPSIQDTNEADSETKEKPSTEQSPTNSKARKRRQKKQMPNSLQEMTSDSSMIIPEQIKAEPKKPQRKQKVEKESGKAAGQQSTPKAEASTLKQSIEFNDASYGEAGSLIHTLIQNYKTKPSELALPNSLFIKDGLVHIHYLKATKQVTGKADPHCPAKFSENGWIKASGGQLITKCNYNGATIKALALKEEISDVILAQLQRPSEALVVKEATVINPPKDNTSKKESERPVKEQGVKQKPVQDKQPENESKPVMESTDADVPADTAMVTWFIKQVVSGHVNNANYDPQADMLEYAIPLECEWLEGCPTDQEGINKYLKKLIYNSSQSAKIAEEVIFEIRMDA